MRAFFDLQDTIAGTVPAGAVLSSFNHGAPDDFELEVWFDLGVMLSTGWRGHPCDLIEAHKWFNIAACSGHAPAADARADLAREMSPREIAEAQRRAREWLGKAATRTPGQSRWEAITWTGGQADGQAGRQASGQAGARAA